MLSDSKILVTGVAGQIAFPMARFLAQTNDVWGLARFSAAGSREKVQNIEVTPVACDLATGDFRGVPDDFDYVIHLAAAMPPGLDYDGAITANAEGTGLLLQHCRNAKAALVMSTFSIYKPQQDPMYVFAESAPLGDVNAAHAPSYSVSKIGQEAVARFCARAFDLPITVARMNASYGPNGGLPAMHADLIAAGSPVITRWEPCMYSPIYEDDINTQAAALLDAASVPAAIVNWAGDEAVSAQDWCAYAGELLGVTPQVIVKPVDETLRGSISDNARRLAITGPCAVDWRDGMRRTIAARHPGRT
ncbi:MAG: NAD(P)-dependent oxidoreductase [Ilumatobacteraceae bacterium]